MVDLRMNIMNEYVDYFVISESTRRTRVKKKLNFKIENFKKYKNKIIYLVADFKDNKDFSHTKEVSQLLSSIKEII